MIKLILFIFILLILNNHNNQNNKQIEKDYIIIGSGPAGLQFGYFCEQFNLNYLILEKNNKSGSFFQIYPKHRKLISINKVHSKSKNAEFNLRHDWNSLLSKNSKIRLKKFSPDYYPHANDFVKYLNYFKKYYKINVKYNTNVKKIYKNNNKFIIKTNNRTYICKYLIVATGLFTMNIPDFIGNQYTENYENITLNKNKYKNKDIAIIGRGNSAFETANYLLDTANSIQIIGGKNKNAIKLAWQTHYVGDLRAVNNEFLDTYQLKSMNSLVESNINQVHVKKKNNKMIIINKSKAAELNMPKDGYDHIILCTGWKIDNTIFHENCKPFLIQNKVPKLTNTYESKNINNMFFIGTLMTNNERTNAGFIHGFRYLIEFMFNCLLEKNHNKELSFISIKKDRSLITNHVIKQINISSGIYQMFNVLADFIIIEKNKFKYYSNIPLDYGKNRFNNLDYMTITFEYNENYGGEMNYIQNDKNSTYVFGRNRGKSIKSKSTNNHDYSIHGNFLHPIVRYYKKNKLIDTFYFLENTNITFDHPIYHINAFKQFITKVVF